MGYLKRQRRSHRHKVEVEVEARILGLFFCNRLGQ